MYRYRWFSQISLYKHVYSLKLWRLPMMCLAKKLPWTLRWLLYFFENHGRKNRKERKNQPPKNTHTLKQNTVILIGARLKTITEMNSVHFVSLPVPNSVTRIEESPLYQAFNNNVITFSMKKEEILRYTLLRPFQSGWRSAMGGFSSTINNDSVASATSIVFNYSCNLQILDTLRPWIPWFKDKTTQININKDILRDKSRIWW